MRIKIETVKIANLRLTWQLVQPLDSYFIMATL